MENIIIIAVLVVILAVGVKGTIKHLKGEGSCCGGGKTIKEPDKKLSGKIIQTKVFKIDGMHCESCSNRVKRAINSIDGVSAKLDLFKKQAVVKYEKDVADETLVKAIENLGYTVTGIQ